MTHSSTGIRGRTSVLERTRHFEKISAEPQSPSHENNNHGDEEESEDDGMDFAELIRNITSESASGMDETGALEEAFRILDFDSDGLISVSDLRQAMVMFNDDEETENSGRSESQESAEDGENTDANFSDEEQLREMIAEADSDGDGMISFADFLTVLKKPETGPEPEPEMKDTKKRKDSTRRKKHKNK